ncbi:hypothetical protein ACFWPQ_42160 [Streptomyces sp. NPDC058464]
MSTRSRGSVAVTDAVRTLIASTARAMIVRRRWPALAGDRPAEQGE